MSPHPKSSAPASLVKIPTILAVAVTGITVALAANAQVATQPAQPMVIEAPVTTAPVTEAPTLTDILAPDPSNTEVPITNSFQPQTPWPVPASISTTVLQAPEDILAYSGVDAALRDMLGADYAMWQSNYANPHPTEVDASGLLYKAGCLDDCSTKRSFVVVNPATRRVYAAMVTPGKVAMWPSLMSWPDEAIPSLKFWLSDAAEDTAKK